VESVARTKLKRMLRMFHTVKHNTFGKAAGIFRNDCNAIKYDTI